MEKTFKSYHQQKIKRNQKYKQQRKEVIQQFQLIKQKISQYSNQQLLLFMEDQYEKFIDSKSYIAGKINNEIIKKILSLPKIIKQNQENLLKKYIIQIGIDISNQQLKNSCENNQFRWINKTNSRCQVYLAWNGRYNIDFNRRTINPFHKQVLKCNLKQEDFYYPLHKRIKKEAIEMIKKALSFEQQAKKIDQL